MGYLQDYRNIEQAISTQVVWTTTHLNSFDMKNLNAFVPFDVKLNGLRAIEACINLAKTHNMEVVCSFYKECVYECEFLSYNEAFSRLLSLSSLCIGDFWADKSLKTLIYVIQDSFRYSFEATEEITTP